VGILSKEKPNDPVEAALRPLGDLATPELARYLSRPLHPAHAERRAAAARIIAETGTLKSAAALVQLLQHSEPEVRVIAARGLTRLNDGKDLGFGEAVWKGEALEAGQKAWGAWLKQNSKP
jgi:HEAT repeat protein